jgi:hypothetical protein
MSLVSRVLRSRHLAVAESLGKCAPAVEQVGPGRWSLLLSNGTVLLVSAAVIEDWLVLDAPLPAADHAGWPPAWQLLRLNAGLDGASRIVRSPEDSDLRLRSEIPLDEEVNLFARVRETCAGFERASDTLQGECTPGDLAAEWPARPGPSVAAPQLGREPETDAVDLARLCTQAGWPFVTRDEGRLAVDLGLDGEGPPAVIARRADGSVETAADLVRGDDLTALCREAVAWLLVAASGLVRFAKPAVRTGEGRSVARVEVTFPTPPCAAELGHALSALSVACGLVAREVQVLRDDRVAREYLSSRASS